MWAERESSLADPHGGPAATDIVSKIVKPGGLHLCKLSRHNISGKKTFFWPNPNIKLPLLCLKNKFFVSCEYNIWCGNKLRYVK